MTGYSIRALAVVRQRFGDEAVIEQEGDCALWTVRVPARDPWGRWLLRDVARVTAGGRFYPPLENRGRRPAA